MLKISRKKQANIFYLNFNKHINMFEDLTKTELYAILAGVFTASLIISNIIAGKTFEFFYFTLPCGVIIFSSYLHSK